MPVHIRLDVDVVEFFRAAGPRYQSRISAALAELVRLTREGDPVTDSLNRVWAIADEASSKVDRAMQLAGADVPAALSLLSETTARFVAELLAVKADVPDALNPVVESALQQLVGIVRSLALARDQLFAPPSPP